MDRRTLLAFGLIGVIIFLMPYYFRWINGEPVLEDPSVEQPAMMDTTDPVQSAPALQATPTPAPDPVQPTAPQEVTDLPEPATLDFVPEDVLVETDRFSARFSTRGGKVVSWRLKEHFDSDGRPLEIITPGSGGLGLTIAGHSTEFIRFTPNRSTLELTGDEQGELIFSAEVNGKTLSTRYLIQGNRYRMELAIQTSGLTVDDRVALGWDTFPADTEGDAGNGGGFYGFDYDQIVTSAGEEIETWSRDNLTDPERSQPSGRVSWVTIRGKYFLGALIPTDDLRYDVILNEPPPTDRAPDIAAISTRYPGEPLTFGIYIGPLSYTILKNQNVDLFGREATVNLDELVQFGWAFFRPVLKPATILIIHAFSALHNAIPNYGFVIIIFSILVKIVLFPLTRKSTESMAKMQELQPQITALREKHGDNQQKLNQEMMKLYKDQKVNPLGGCLPLFLQAPILFSLFNVFRGAIELRQAHFGLWITDLSKPDVLTLPGIGFDLHVLPLIMATSMFVQQKLTMKDPKQAALVYIMPVFMIYIFWSMSSGLVLYFTMYNLLSVFEQKMVKKSNPAPATT